MSSGREEDWTNIDNRKAVEFNGEMALYFIQNNPTKLPNRKELEFNRTACLIWRMADGAVNCEEYCSDDELGPMNTTVLRNIPAELTLNQETSHENQIA